MKIAALIIAFVGGCAACETASPWSDTELNGTIGGYEMGNLPVSRTATLVPGDPVPPNLLNELQDNLVALNVELSGGIQTLWPANPTLAGDLTVGGQLLPFADFTFTADSTTDLCTATGHPLQTGSGPIRTSNSGGGLPGGLAAATDYFAIKVSSSTFKLSTSQANAISGTAIDITSNGTGTQTINHQTTTSRVSDVHATRNLVSDFGATIAGIASVGTLTAGSASIFGTLTTGATQVGLITPTLASGNNNNFNPTGAAAATAMIVGATATSAITGMAGGVNGRLVWIMNNSGFNVTITHNDSNSSAGNRFLSPGGTTITLASGNGNATLWIYDSSANSWRMLGKNF